MQGPNRTSHRINGTVILKASGRGRAQTWRGPRSARSRPTGSSEPTRRRRVTLMKTRPRRRFGCKRERNVEWPPLTRRTGRRCGQAALPHRASTLAATLPSLCAGRPAPRPMRFALRLATAPMLSLLEALVSAAPMTAGAGTGSRGKHPWRQGSQRCAPCTAECMGARPHAAWTSTRASCDREGATAAPKMTILSPTMPTSHASDAQPQLQPHARDTQAIEGTLMGQGQHRLWCQGQDHSPARSWRTARSGHVGLAVASREADFRGREAPHSLLRQPRHHALVVQNQSPICLSGPTMPRRLLGRFPLPYPSHGPRGRGDCDEHMYLHTNIRKQSGSEMGIASWACGFARSVTLQGWIGRIGRHGCRDDHSRCRRARISHGHCGRHGSA